MWLVVTSLLTLCGDDLFVGYDGLRKHKGNWGQNITGELWRQETGFGDHCSALCTVFS